MLKYSITAYIQRNKLVAHNNSHSLLFHNSISSHFNNWTNPISFHSKTMTRTFDVEKCGFDWTKRVPQLAQLPDDRNGNPGEHVACLTFGCKLVCFHCRREMAPSVLGTHHNLLRPTCKKCVLHSDDDDVPTEHTSKGKKIPKKKSSSPKEVSKKTSNKKRRVFESSSSSSAADSGSEESNNEDDDKEEEARPEKRKKSAKKKKDDNDVVPVPEDEVIVDDVAVASPEKTPATTTTRKAPPKKTSKAPPSKKSKNTEAPPKKTVATTKAPPKEKSSRAIANELKAQEKAAMDALIREVARSLNIPNAENIRPKTLDTEIFLLCGMDAKTFKDSNADPSIFIANNLRDKTNKVVDETTEVVSKS